MKNLYLFLFNITCCIWWLYILFLTLPHLSNAADYKRFESNVSKPLQCIVILALMEIVHIIFKLQWMITNVFITVIHLLQRIFFVWCIFYYRDMYQLTTGDTRTAKIPYGPDFEVGILGCCLAWAAIEALRYLFDALHIYGMAPFVLLSARYSVFTVLYPTGIFAEIYSIWLLRK
eukprot:99272_1